MTLIFDLRPRSFHQVVSLSWTIDQRNDRETAECAFSDIFRHDEISTPIARVGTSLLFKSPHRASMNTRPTGRASYSLFHHFMNLYPVHTICQTK